MEEPRCLGDASVGEQRHHVGAERGEEIGIARRCAWWVGALVCVPVRGERRNACQPAMIRGTTAPCVEVRTAPNVASRSRSGSDPPPTTAGARFSETVNVDPDANVALDREIALHAASEVATDREPESHAFARIPERPIELNERLEDDAKSIGAEFRDRCPEREPTPDHRRPHSASTRGRRLA